MDLTLLTEENYKAFLDFMPESFGNTLLSPDSVAVGAVDETGTACGVLLATVSGEWLELLWIYVAESERGRGIARDMLNYLLASAFSVDHVRGLTAQFGPEYYLSPLYNLFKRQNFSLSREPLSVYSITVGDVKENSFFKDQPSSGALLPLSEIPSYTLLDFEKKLMLSSTGTPLDIPVNWHEYDQACSIGYIRDQELRGILLFTHDENDLVLSFAYADPGERTALSLMLRASGGRIVSAYDPNTRITLSTLNHISSDIFERLFPGIEKTPACRATYTIYRTGGSKS